MTARPTLVLGLMPFPPSRAHSAFGLDPGNQRNTMVNVSSARYRVITGTIDRLRVRAEGLPGPNSKLQTPNSRETPNSELERVTVGTRDFYQGWTTRRSEEIFLPVV